MHVYLFKDKMDVFLFIMRIFFLFFFKNWFPYF
jgi:hypothetical protein